jgi:aspartyl-tRNA(Asn)/glutamyl-tRNA(Gln) amidotransferase subunit B
MHPSLRLNKNLTKFLCQNVKLSSQPKIVSNYTINKDDLKVKIGLEIHARILSNTKIFSDSACSSNIVTNTLSNTNVSLFDCALPGTMPTLNRRCVEASLLTALALNCKINSVSTFERKHYFYPDLPAGYQITQQENPVALSGHLNYPIYNPKTNKISYKTCRIRRIQLEHDSARSLQLENLTLNLKNKQEKLPDNTVLIDLNRAGVGLMEIVTEPDFETAFDCYSFVRELAFLLRSIETCDASSVSIGEGSFRVDVNISLHKQDNNGNLLPGVRVELKNLGNFNSLLKASEYEIKRQASLLKEDKQILAETRTFDSNTHFILDLTMFKN